MACAAKPSAGLPLTGRWASAPRRKAWAGAATVSRATMKKREVRRMTEVLGRRSMPLSGRTLNGAMPDAPLSRRALFTLGLGRLGAAFGNESSRTPRPPSAPLDPERLAFEQADLHALTAEGAATLATVAAPLPGEDVLVVRGGGLVRRPRRRRRGGGRGADRGGRGRAAAGGRRARVVPRRGRQRAARARRAAAGRRARRKVPGGRRYAPTLVMPKMKTHSGAKK